MRTLNSIDRRQEFCETVEKFLRPPVGRAMWMGSS